MLHTYITHLCTCAQNTTEEEHGAGFKSTLCGVNASVNAEGRQMWPVLPSRSSRLTKPYGATSKATLRKVNAPHQHGACFPQFRKEPRLKRFPTYINPAIYLEDYQ